MDERSQVALLARAALGADNAPSAIAALRRLVFAEPRSGVWRVRLAEALAANGETEAAARLREELAAAAAAAGRPLDALLAALDAGLDADALVTLFAGYLADSGRLARGPRPAPPVAVEDAGPLPEVDPGAQLPPYPRSEAPEHLPPVPLISALHADGFRALAPALRRRALGAGEVLLGEGEAADALYIVVDGVLDVVKTDPVRLDVVVGQVGAGTLVGEMALVLDRVRTATVRGQTECELVRVDLAALKHLAADDEAVARAVSVYTRRRLLELLLSTSPVFRDMDAAARAAVLSRFELIDVPDGAVLVEQGEPGRALRVIVDGEVEVLCAEGGEQTRVARLGPGEVFGEISLLTDQLATAMVVATADTTLLELPRPVFAQVCAAHPALAAQLERLGMERLADNRFIFADDEFIEAAD